MGRSENTRTTDSKVPSFGLKRTVASKARKMQAGRMTPRLAFVFCAALALTSTVAAVPRTCAGIKFSDRITVDSANLVLNGIGLREATIFNVDVYVAALYVKELSTSAKQILSSSTQTRVVLRFVRDVAAQDIRDEIEEGIGANTPDASREKTELLLSWFEDAAVGDFIIFTYTPKAGLEVKVRGQVRGYIPDVKFARAVLSSLIGPAPIDEDMKTGLLGGACG